MNKKASELSLKNTHFESPHGLDSDNHYTTAYELALLTNYALNNSTFAKIVGTKNYTITINGYPKTLNNTNELLGNLDGVYGVTFNEENGIYKDIDILLTDKKKVDVIKQVQKDNKETNNIIYFGDGLTDSLAFEYVNSIGGKNVFIATKNESIETYKQLNVKGIIDKCFEPDFSMDSELSKYIQTQIEEEKCK